MMASRCVIIAGALLAILNCNETGFAQIPTPTATAASLTTEEKVLVERAVLSDPRIRAIVGEGQPRITTTDVQFDKAEAEAFLTGRSTTPPTRRVTVVLINPQTQQAARALIEASQNRVLTVESIAASDVPFLPEEAEEALALVKADLNVRRAIGDTLDRYVTLQSGNEARVPFAAQALPLRSSDPRDVCSIHRCVDLIFRTEQGYLPFRAHVDLTARTVEIHGSLGVQHR